MMSGGLVTSRAIVGKPRLPSLFAVFSAAQ
jgi:hypothetical protein